LDVCLEATRKIC